MAADQRHDHHFASALNNVLSTNHVLRTIVPSLDDHVRIQRFYKPLRGWLIKDHYTVYRCEGCQYPRTRTLIHHWASGTLRELACGIIAVQPYNQRSTFAPGGLQEFNMPGIQQVEHAVGEHHRLSGLGPPCDGVGPLPDLGGAAGQIGSTALGLKVITLGPSNGSLTLC